MAKLFPDIVPKNEIVDGAVIQYVPDTLHIHIENKLGCSELFDYYAKSLAG